MRAFPLLLIGALQLAGPLAGHGVAQDTDAETWAALLVDHPLAAKGDRDRVVASWLSLLGEEPSHPLAEGTLKLIEVSLDELDDPAALAGQIKAIPADGLSPLAQRQLARLQAMIAVRRAPVAELDGKELFPDYLSRYVVLGPLPPLDDPLAFRQPSPELAEPGFGEPHAVDDATDDDEPLLWQEATRNPLRPFVRPSAVLESTHGVALAAARFDAPGGPAWIEIDVGSSGDVSSTGDPRARGAASFAFSLNGEPPVVSDFYGREASPVVRAPVLLRDGRNQLVIKTILDGRTALAVRVLAPDGSPLAGLQEAIDEQPLGSPVAGSPPQDAPQTSSAWLAALPEPSPSERALLGVLTMLEGREAEGMASLRAAVDAAPGAHGLTALLARVTARARYLPEQWKKNRARTLAEGVWAAQPERLDSGLFLAALLADEDQEEEAITRLKALTELHTRQTASLLELVRVYERLNMDAQAEEALMQARERAPNSPEVLRRLAQLQERHGQESAGAQLSLAALRATGANGRDLQTLARRFAELGQPDVATDLYREALARDDNSGLRLSYARWLQDVDRLDESEALLRELQTRFPHWEAPCLELADAARLRGDTEAEIAALRDAQERRPSLRATRDRLFALTGEDDTEALFARWRADPDAVRKAYDPAGRNDSVVKLLDHAVVKVFEDGGTETLAQEVYQARDLQACEQLGDMRLQGEVIEIATVKPDGTVFEPVRLNNYVMPSLKPGDFVSIVTRELRAPPTNHVVRVGRWSFQSMDEPFVQSRYVVSIPKDLPVRLEQRHYTGTHETEDAGDSVVHVFEMRDQPRVLAEPQMPRAEQFLPWIEYGMDVEKASEISSLAMTVLDPALVTPEIREAAQGALAGVTGDTARAKALHTFVNKTLDQRGWGTATQALLAREGSATMLYAALLEAADVPRELVYTRNIAPDSEPEPDPPFFERGRLGRKLLVLVHPRDGEPAFCDMDAKTMPYGHLMGNAPGALALALPSQRELTLPDLPLSERPGPLGADFHMDFAVAADGSSEFQGDAELKAGIGFVAKEQIREIPALMRKGILTQVAAQVVPGLDVSDFKLPGLDDEDKPVRIEVKGRIPTFLDSDGSALTCKLPLPTLDMAESIAGGEGERKLPYFLDDALASTGTARLRLGEGLSVLELPASVQQDSLGGSYELRFEQPSPDVLTIHRTVALKPFLIQPGDYAEFAAFCARIDEAERGLLRFARTGEGPAPDAMHGAADGAASDAAGHPAVPTAPGALEPAGVDPPRGGR